MATTRKNGTDRVWEALPDNTKVEVLQMALLICLGKLYGRGCGWLYLEALKLRREAMHMVLNKVMK